MEEWFRRGGERERRKLREREREREEGRERGETNWRAAGSCELPDATLLGSDSPWGK